MYNKSKILLIFLFLISFAANAFAEGEPLQADVAFKFNAEVKGQHILATWTMAPDYYMYHEKFHFQSATPDVILGTPVFPKGVMKHGIKPDGSEGMVETYMNKVTIDIPISKVKPGTKQFKLVAKGQGCAEKLGICYPPQTRDKQLTLASAGSATAGVSDLSAQLGLDNATDNPLPAEQAFQFSAAANSKVILATWTMAPDYYMYKDKFSFTAKTPGLHLGKPEIPPGKMKHGIKPDGSEGMVETYLNKVTIKVPYTLDNKVDGIELIANGQGCAEKLGICYPPQHRAALVSVSQTTTAPETASNTPPPSTAAADNAGTQTSADTTTNKTKKYTGWALIGLLFGALAAGLGLTFTPCVLPMLQIITTIIIGQGDKVSKARGGGLASIYVLGTALVWTAVGVFAALTGTQLQGYTSSPIFVLPVVVILLILSLAMFDIFTLQLPASWQSKAQETSAGLKGGTIAGVFVMGILASVIAGACVTPVLAFFLGLAITSHDPVLGGMIMFSLALGMGIPIILVGVGAGWLLPKAGTWMDIVKYVFGVLLIGLALYIVSSIPWIPVLYLWAPFLIATGVYMGAVRQIPEGASGWRTLWKGLGIFLVVWGVLALVGAMQGNRDILQPIRLGYVSGGGSAVSSAVNPEAMFDVVHDVNSLEAKLNSAKAAGKPVFLDYYATWCTDCNLMKKNVFNKAEVQQYMGANFVSIQADVSDQFDKRTQPMKAKFGVIGPPALLFFDKQGKLVKKHYGEMSTSEFLDAAKAVAAK